ncbi:MAG: hypothetical protein Kow00109_13300 [Acidobacteriota bacterium]
MRFRSAPVVLCCLIGGSSGGLVGSQAGPSPDDFRRQIESLLEDGRVDEAWHSAERAWELHGRNSALAPFLAQVALATGHVAEAGRWAEEGLRAGTLGADIFLAWARWALLRGEVQQARQFLDLVPPEGRSPEWWFLASKQRFFAGETAMALADVRRAVSGDPAKSEYRVWYSVLLETEGDLPAAAAEMQKAVRLGRARVNDLLRWTELEIRLRRWGRAREVAELAIDRDRENPRAWRLLARALREQGDEVAAVEAETRARRFEEAFAVLQEVLGFLRSADLASAASRLAAVVGRNPDFVPALLLQGRVLARSGREEEAVQTYLHVLAIDPSREEAREEAAWLLVKRGDAAGALNLLAESYGNADLGARDDSANRWAALWASVAALRAEDRSAWKDALAAWRAVAERYPADTGVARRIADTLRRQGRFEEALGWLERAYQAEPWEEELLHEAREIRFAYAVRCLEEGRLAEAEKELRRLAEEDPANPGYLYYLGYVALERGDWAGALEHFQAAGDLTEAPEWVVKNAALCMYSLERYDEAADLWRRLYERRGEAEAAYNLGLCLLRGGAVEEGWNWIRRAAQADFPPAQETLRLYRLPQ